MEQAETRRGAGLNNIAPAVLLGDDEPLMRRVLHTLLNSRGYITHEAANGEEILDAVSRLHPDVILLDLGLPDLDGIEVIRRLRRAVATPIIVLSVRAAESDKTDALDAGADDYLTKPYQSAELCERIRAAVVRTARSDKSVLIAGDLAVDLRARTVEVGHVNVQLTPSEFNLLSVLVLNAGRLLTQNHLAEKVWAGGPEAEPLQLLRTTINTLRAKLESDPSRPRHIVTEPGVGYRLRVLA